MAWRSSPCRRARDCRPGSIAPSQAPTASVRPADPAASPEDDLPLGGDARMAVTVPEILVEADACPVKDEVYPVAGGYELNVRNVATSFKIGEASGRESVCQYVEIWGVDGSLKKKQKQ